MPAIETLPSVLSPATEAATLTTKEAVLLGDAFEQAMTDALSSGGEKSEAGAKPKLGFLTAVKRPPAQSASAPASPQNVSVEPSAGESTESPGEIKKLATTSAKEENVSDTSTPLLIPPVDLTLVPMLSFSSASPGNFFATPAPTPAAGGNPAPSPTATALAGFAGKVATGPAAMVRNISTEISSQPQPASKPADLMRMPAAPAGKVSNLISAPVASLNPNAVASQSAAPIGVSSNASVSTPQNFAAPPAAIANLQSALGPISAIAPTPAAPLEMPASDSAVAVPTNFQAVADVLGTTPQAGNFTTANIAANDSQQILTPSRQAIQESARKPEPMMANNDVAVSSNIPTHVQPEKNLAGLLVPSALHPSVLAEAMPALSIDSGAAPKALAGTLPDEVTVRGELNSVPMPAAALNTGTGVASTLSAMKKSDKVEFFAGQAGQNLPVAGPTRAATGALASVLPELPPRRSEIFSADYSPFTNTSPDNNFAAGSSTTSVSAATLPSLSEARLQTVERTHDLVSAHALRLVESKSDSMSLVLKPGGGTELSLELRQRNGVVEAQAYLAAGDHQLLNQHWADLQSRLELRGVKLGPLGGEDSFTSGGNFSQQRSPSRDEETERAAAFAEFAAVSGGATARSAMGGWGWESWA